MFLYEILRLYRSNLLGIPLMPWLKKETWRYKLWAAKGRVQYFQIEVNRKIIWKSIKENIRITENMNERTEEKEH